MPRPAPALALLLAAAAPAAAQEGEVRVERDAFRWEGAVPEGRWLYLRNMNGPVRVERGSGGRVLVTAERRTRGTVDPRDEVRFVRRTAEDGEGVVVCALWGERASCDERGYRNRSNDDDRWRDRRENRGWTSVSFTVRVPPGVRVDASTVNGGLEVSGVASEVVARTVNGSVRAESDGGPVVAGTVNGSVHARMRSVGDARDLEFTTVNGSVTVEVPAGIGAELELSTVNGRVETDFPVTVQGRIDPRRLRATLGDGSRRVRLRTVNGSVSLRRAD